MVHLCCLDPMESNTPIRDADKRRDTDTTSETTKYTWIMMLSTCRHTDHNRKDQGEKDSDDSIEEGEETDDAELDTAGFITT